MLTKVTESAERAVPGCPVAVRSAFASYLALPSKEETLARLGICPALPPYLAQGGVEALRLAVNMVVMYSFAGEPGPQPSLGV